MHRHATPGSPHDTTVRSPFPQEHYLVEGAMQHPGGNGGLRVLLRKVGATYGSILACFFNDFTLQVTGAYTYVVPRLPFLPLLSVAPLSCSL